MSTRVLGDVAMQGSAEVQAVSQTAQNESRIERKTPLKPVPQAAGGARGSLGIALMYLWNTTRNTLTDVAFFGFLIILPVGMYLFFSTANATDPATELVVKRYIMVSMATYGAMGAALSAGNLLQSDRATGWFRQLMLTKMTPTMFLTVRTIGIVLLLIPSIVAVLIAGRITGVEVEFHIYLAIIGVAILVLLPFIVMGLAIGLWVSQKASSGVTTLVMLGMAMLGGLFIPTHLMPESLQDISKFLPSYWANEISRLILTGDPLEPRGVITLAVWFAGAALLAILGYRRAVTTAKR
ncbi:MAG: ABC transporter permease [Microbacteriaceae bacterium]|nr:ABC transporter permease [Microbacteriaceae bacterium]